MGRFNKVEPSKGFNNSNTDRKNRQSDESGNSGRIGNSKAANKKPFDKKTWRLQKYSKKYKLEQWEEKRKKAILRGYYKEIKDESKVDVQKIYEQYDSDEDVDCKESESKHNLRKRSVNLNEDVNVMPSEENVEEKGPKRKNKAYNKAQHEFERLKQEKVQAKEERLKQKQEREEALKLYKKKKNEKFKKLNKKTKRGQPIMKDRIEMLLEKIQSS